ncbi:unnamed protein product [Diamesa serratosioi]
MKAFLVVFCLVAAVASQQNSNIVVDFLDNGTKVCRTLIPGVPLAQCPPSNCPPIGDRPELNRNCGMPDCRLFVSQNWLWPSVDPNFFYQCRPIVGGWEALRMPCGCMTLFDYTVQRCVHPEEYARSTTRCNASPPSPIPAPCPIVCLDCDGNKIPTGPIVIPTLPPITVLPTAPQEITTPGTNNCQCPCVPCVWWPCQPCQNNCPCNIQG